MKKVMVKMYSQNKITYLSNAGVMLAIADKKILVDAFCNSTIAMYKNLPPEIREQIINGNVPFDNIDLLLITHHHADHFDPIGVVRFLKSNQNTILISTSEVISQINTQFPEIEKGRLIEPSGAGEIIQINNINVQTFSMLHDGKDYWDVDNLAYLLEVNGIKILHVGDAKAIKENFISLNLTAKEIELLIVPFPYVGLPTGRQLIDKFINPKKIAAVHLPYRELDHDHWIDTTIKNYMKVKDDFTKVIFMEEIGHCIIL